MSIQSGPIGFLNLKLSGNISSTTGPSSNGVYTLGVLPAGCVLSKVYYVSAVAGSGSSSPTLSIGYTLATPTEVVNAQTPTLTAGTSAQPTLAVTLPALLSTSARTLYVKVGGTWSDTSVAGSAFRGAIYVEYTRIGEFS